MSGSHPDQELMLAKLLSQIDESTVPGTLESDTNMEDLSPEQLQDLCAAKNCLVLLDQVRLFEQASTLNGSELTTGPGQNELGGNETTNVLGQQVGRYQLKKKIGHGGFAEVFLAYDPVLERDVALKVPHSLWLKDSEALRRFLREGRAAATLDHPAIIPVFETGNDGIFHYISMAFSSGESLAKMIAERGEPFDQRIAAAVVSQLAKALSHSHLRGIIHRDIKPGNILVDQPTTASPELYQRVRLTDFGLVKYDKGIKQELTVDGSVLGTPAYMSPEQAEGRSDVGPGSDIFSLGTVLFQMLTSALPHRKETALKTLHAVCNEPATSIRSICPEVARDLAAITHKCLEKSPLDRYERAHDLAHDLDAWLEGHPISARPIGKAERIHRWIKKNPLVAGSVTLALASLMVGLAVSMAGWNDAATKNAMYLSAKETAEFKSRRAMDSLDSLIRSFQAVDPFQKDNESDSAVSVLLQARQEIENRFNEDPEAKIELLSALAQSLTGVGCYDVALECRQRVHDLTFEQFGESHISSLESLRQLAIAEHNAGNLRVSLNLRERLTQLAEAKLGPTHRDTIRAMTGLGASYREMGLVRKAVDLHRETLLLSEYTGGENELFSNVATNLAATYLEARLLDEAIEINEKELETVTRIFGESHDVTLSVMTSLAASYDVARQKNKATALQQKAFEIAVNQYGENDATTLHYQFLTYQYRPKSDLKNFALPRMVSFVETAARKFGERHPATIFYMNELGRVHRTVREFENAARAHALALDYSTESLGINDYRTIELMLELSIDRLRLDDHSEALQLASDAVQRIVVQVGPEHMLVTEAKQLLGFCHYMGGQNEKAKALAEENLAALGPQLGQSHSKMAKAQRRYVYILLEAEEFGLAESVAEKMVDRLRGQPQIGSHRVASNLLANAQLELGKTDQAEETVAGVLDEDDFGFPAVSLASCVRGSVYYEEGDYDKAEEWLLPHLERLVEHFDDLHFPHQRSMVIRFAKRAEGLFQETGDPELARFWERRVAELDRAKTEIESGIKRAQMDPR